MEMNQQDIKAVEASSWHVSDPKATDNGFAIHAERERTPEEKRIERRLLLKIDTIILPVLALVYFLASMVRTDQTAAISIIMIN